MLRAESPRDVTYMYTPDPYAKPRPEYVSAPKPSLEQIFVEETVDVEWSRITRTGSHDELNLVSLPKVYIVIFMALEAPLPSKGYLLRKLPKNF